MDIVVGPKDGFSERIAEYLNLTFVPLHRRVFPDREICPRIVDAIKGKSVLFVSRTSGADAFHPNRYLIELYLALTNLKSLGAKELNILMPYFVYARQDKVFREGEVVSAKAVLDLLKNLGVKRFYTVTAHMQREEGKLRFYDEMECYTIDGFEEIGKYIKAKYNPENPLVLGPDLTASSGAETVAKVLGISESSALEKFRDRDTGATETKGELPELNGRDVIIVDDIAATGGTMSKAVSMCKEKGAGKIICAVVHPVLAQDCLNRIRNTGAEFIGCNTIESCISKVHVEKKIAEFIKQHS